MQKSDKKLIKEEELTKEYVEQQKRVDSIKQLLKAYRLFEKDVHYVINDNKVIIVDEFTGRMMPGRRFSDGIHEALEAKENVSVELSNDEKKSEQKIPEQKETLGVSVGDALESAEVKK